MALRLVANFLVLPLATDAGLITGLTTLTDQNFDDFIQNNKKTMVDFVRGNDQTEQLKRAAMMLRQNGNNVPFGRIDIDKYPDVAKRYFDACNEEKQQCSVQFPHLLWFVNSHASQYHRSLTDAVHIASFVAAMDRDLVSTIQTIDEEVAFNPYLLFRGEKTSDMYQVLEHLAARHMDTVAVIHYEEPGSSNVSWIINGTVNDTFGDTPDEDSVEHWLRHHLTFSDDKPEQEVDEHGTHIVVASTFEEKVLRNDTDVFLLVYAPWCGFSRKVMPEWSKFAKNLTGSAQAGLVLAKMDGAENVIETQEYKWKTYPTMVYFRAGDPTPRIFEGDRTVEGFYAFVKEHGSSTVNVPLASEDIILMQSGRGASYREAMGDYTI